jgi:hypothetical protein
MYGEAWLECEGDWKKLFWLEVFAVVDIIRGRNKIASLEADIQILTDAKNRDSIMIKISGPSNSAAA